MNKNEIQKKRNETNLRVTDTIIKSIKTFSLGFDKNGINVSLKIATGQLFSLQISKEFLLAFLQKAS